jgi:cell wall-associated NlpC family hydrolase
MRTRQPRSPLPVALLATLIAAMILALPVLAAKARPAWVIPETLTVRSGPRLDSKRIGALNRGTKVYVTAFANKWCWCTLPSGAKGWIAEWFLQFSPDQGRQIAAASGKSTTSSAGKPQSSGGTPPAWINVSQANVRSAPGLGGKSYGTLNQGAKVYVLARQGDWAKCKTPGGDGWVRTDLLEYDVSAGRKLAAAGGATSKPASAPASAVAKDSGKAYVTEDGVCLRSGPGARFEKRANLVKGQTLYISARKDQWRKVTVHGGNSGWVAAWLIKEDTPKSAPSNPDTPDVARTDCVLTAWVSADSAQVHDRPSREAEVKFTAKQGAKVRVAAVCGHWCKVRTDDGQYGWVAGWNIKFVPPGKAITTKEEGETVEVNVGWVARPVVNLRTAPSTDAPSSGDAKLGTRLLIIGRKPGWYKVALEDGNIGWMSSRLIDTRAERQVRERHAMAGKDNSKSCNSSDLARSLTPHDDFPSPTSHGDSEGGGGMGARLVNAARRYLGYPYVTGGTGPNVFDCCGFTWYIHHINGMDIDFGVDAQFRRGTPVARDDLQPGDVIFFQNTYKSGLSHVALYAGHGQFIHACSPGEGVRMDPLSMDYYASRYVGARRMH